MRCPHSARKIQRATPAVFGLARTTCVLTRPQPQEVLHWALAGHHKGVVRPAHVGRGGYEGAAPLQCVFKNSSSLLLSLFSL
jgi:hypothetical protein